MEGKGTCTCVVCGGLFLQMPFRYRYKWIWSRIERACNNRIVEIVYKIGGSKLIFSEWDSSSRERKAWEFVPCETPV